MDDSIYHFVSKTWRPMISFTFILHNCNQVRLKVINLSSLYVSETVMKLLSLVLVVGVKQCQYSASFRGDCHLYALSCTKCGKSMHERQCPIMTLFQLAPRIILNHFDLGTSRWNKEILTKLQSDGSLEYRRNPAQVLFSLADGMIDSLKNMEIVQQGIGHDESTMSRWKFVIGAEHVKGAKFDQEELIKELIIQINNTNAMKMDANL